MRTTPLGFFALILAFLTIPGGLQAQQVEPVSGIDIENVDNRQRPQDDFFRYVNGLWLERTQIPADRSNYGSFTELADQSEIANRQIEWLRQPA